MPPALLPEKTRLGYAHLLVADLDRSLAFYQGILGLSLLSREDAQITLAAPDSLSTLLVLEARPQARPKPPRTTGLYHIALRFPNRNKLAGALQRLIDFRWPLLGAADHQVSEALYLADPDSLGLELYADRPREFWPRRGDAIAMTTDPLDLHRLLAEADQPYPDGEYRSPGIDLGHVHLQVGDLGEARGFFHDVLGFDVMQEDFPGALFVAAGGYHHHIGLNIWAGVGASAPPPEAVGLWAFSIRVPDEQAFTDLRERLLAGGVAVQDRRSSGDSRGIEIHAPGAVRLHIYAEKG